SKIEGIQGGASNGGGSSSLLSALLGAACAVDWTIGANTCGLKNRTQTKSAVEMPPARNAIESASRSGDGFGRAPIWGCEVVVGMSVDARVTSGIAVEGWLATLPLSSLPARSTGAGSPAGRPPDRANGSFAPGRTAWGCAPE